MVSILVIVGVAFLGSKGASNQAETPLTEIPGLTSTPESYDLGNVPIDGGMVTKNYEIKNTTKEKMKLKKIATSCMCTKASVEAGDKKTRFFGMEGHGDANPAVNLELKAGETAKVVVNFDPAAHGPQGTGAFDRIVWLYFSEGVKELKFNGEVIK